MEEQTTTPAGKNPRPRKAAIGKALLVYLGTGSIGVAILAFLLFRGMGC